MRWIPILIILGVAFVNVTKADETATLNPVDLAIAVSLDRSESIDAEDARVQIEGLVFALRHPQFRKAVAVGRHARIALSVVTWSSFGRHDVILPWVIISNEAEAEVAAKFLRLDHARQRQASHGTQTDVAFAIEVGLAQFDNLPWPATESVINVVADGISNIGKLPAVDRNEAIARQITVNGLIMARGSGIEIMSRYFRREVIAGPTSFVQLSMSNDDFADAMLRKMILELVRLRQTKKDGAKDAG